MTTGHEPSHWSVTDWYSLANVTILVVLAVILLRKAVQEALKSRKENIQTKLIETREELARLEMRIAEMRKEISLIEDKKKDLISKVEQEGRALSDSLIRDAEATSQRILEDAKLAAQAEASDSRLRLRQEIVEEAIAKTKLLLQSDSRNMNAKKIHEQLVDRFVREGSRAFHV